MYRIIAQLKKELIQLSRDKLTLALGFCLPLATLLIFGFAIRMESKNIPMIVQDFDNSPDSRAFIERLVATNQLEPVQWSGGDVMEALDAGKAKVAVVIPPDFSRKLNAGRVADIQAIINGIDVNNARVIQKSIIATSQYYTAVTGSHPISRVNTQLRLIFNPGRAEPLFIVPGVYAVVLAIYPSFLSAIAMVREREQGTLIQVYGSSILPAEFILGKMLAYLVVGIGQTLTVMTVGFICFRIYPLGDPIPLVVSTLTYLTANVLLGLLIGSRSSGQLDAVQAVATIQFMTSMLLSGFLYPRSTIPYPLSLLSELVPARYYIDVVRSAFVRGTGWEGIAFAPIVLSVVACVLFFLNWRTIRPMKLPEPAK